MVSIDDQIECVQREIAMRRAVYPKWVQNRAKNFSRDDADREIARMEAVLATLKQVAGYPEQGSLFE